MCTEDNADLVQLNAQSLAELVKITQTLIEETEAQQRKLPYSLRAAAFLDEWFPKP